MEPDVEVGVLLDGGVECVVGAEWEAAWELWVAEVEVAGEVPEAVMVVWLGEWYGEFFFQSVPFSGEVGCVGVVFSCGSAVVGEAVVGEEFEVVDGVVGVDEGVEVDGPVVLDVVDGGEFVVGYGWCDVLEVGV